MDNKATTQSFEQLQFNKYELMFTGCTLSRSFITTKNVHKIKKTSINTNSNSYDRGKIEKLHPLDFVSVIGHNINYSGKDIYTDTGLKTKQFMKIFDNPMQRFMYDSFDNFYPSSWYVARPNDELFLNEIVGDKELKNDLKQRNGFQDLDGSLLCNFEFRPNKFENAEELIKIDCKNFAQKNKLILLGTEEEERWYHDEIESIIPIYNKNFLYQKLSSIISPLPENKEKGITTHELSVLKPIEPRRPINLYNDTVENHPISQAIIIAKKSCKKPDKTPILWCICKNQSGIYTYSTVPIGDLIVDQQKKSDLIDKGINATKEDSVMPITSKTIKVNLFIDSPINELEKERQDLSYYKHRKTYCNNYDLYRKPDTKYITRKLKYYDIHPYNNSTKNESYENIEQKQNRTTYNIKMPDEIPDLDNKNLDLDVMLDYYQAKLADQFESV